MTSNLPCPFYYHTNDINPRLRHREPPSGGAAVSRMAGVKAVREILRFAQNDINPRLRHREPPSGGAAVSRMAFTQRVAVQVSLLPQWSNQNFSEFK